MSSLPTSLKMVSTGGISLRLGFGGRLARGMHGDASTGPRHICKGLRDLSSSSLLPYPCCFASQSAQMSALTLRKLDSRPLSKYPPTMSASFCSFLRPAVWASAHSCASRRLHVSLYPLQLSARPPRLLLTHVIRCPPSGPVHAVLSSSSCSTLLPRYFSSFPGPRPATPSSPPTPPSSSPSTWPPQPSHSCPSYPSSSLNGEHEGRISTQRSNLPMPPSFKGSGDQQRLDDMKRRRGNVFPWRAALLASCACM